MTMRAPSRDLCSILEGFSELALEYGTNLFQHRQGDETTLPDECVVVYDSGGSDPLYPTSADGGTSVYARPTAQVRVRGKKGRYNETYALASAIHATLNGLANVTVTGARYIGIWAQGEPIDVGDDENKRPIVTVNVRMHRTAT